MYSQYIRTRCDSKANFKVKLKGILQNVWPFLLNPNLNRIMNLLDKLKDNLHLFIEYPYVDKIYRDSYYNYFSSKYKIYQRDCIRVSIFADKIEKDDFENADKYNSLQNTYLGYFVIRPLPSHLLGRSFISPLAYLSHSFLCELTSEKVLIGCHHLTCNGFAHIAQNSETMTCAESSVWMMLEYYSSKYQEYRPVLPSEITEVLSKDSYKRLIPSEGLTIFQISQAIKEFGFATKIYFSGTDKDDNLNFKKYLYYYIESGIPIVLGLQNNKKSGHAVIAIRHSSFDIDLRVTKQIGNIHIIESSNCFNDIVIMDDNKNPYCIVPFDAPGKHYSEDNFKYLKVKYFIVPFYHRIYLDAEKAYIIVESVITDNKIGLRANEKKDPYIIRLFLTSSKSFKQKIAGYDAINPEMKKRLIYTALPKFIWVCEISDNKLYKDHLVNGMIIIDATGESNNDSIIFYYFKNRLLDKNKEKGNLSFIQVNWGHFSIYRNNLKGDWNNFGVN